MKVVRNPFGGLRVDFSKCGDVTLLHVFGEEPLLPSEMNKKLWQFIKHNALAKKPEVNEP